MTRKRKPFVPVDTWGFDEPYLLTDGDSHAYIEGQVVVRLTAKEWKQLKKPTGVHYYGTDPGYFDGWIYGEADLFGPIAHVDWEMAAFQQGGWSS